ncbi:MAG TPA: hypothetical protein DEA40_13155, partial [Parvularcula sp.]|nr:hypothetical protein [Parvularcula sp.]
AEFHSDEPAATLRLRHLADCASAKVMSCGFLKKPRAPAGGASALKKKAPKSRRIVRILRLYPA